MEKSYLEFCPKCAHFSKRRGFCTGLDEDIITYPKTFNTKCNGDFFKEGLSEDLADDVESNESDNNNQQSKNRFSPLTGLSLICIVAGFMGVKSGLFVGLITFIIGIIAYYFLKSIFFDVTDFKN